MKLTGDYKSNMDKTLTITYTTDFNYENLSKENDNKSFKNTANLSWIDINNKRTTVHLMIHLILITTQKETDLNTVLTMPKRKKLNGT